VRSRIQTTESAALLALMFLGACVLWIGVPLLWLYIGSLVQDSTGSVGAAIGIMLPGTVFTIMLVVRVLALVNDAYEHLREARGLQNFGQAPLEAVLVVSAIAALLVCVVWVFIFTDSAPMPIPGTG
jgi:hypothetical protein